jgi:probable rRNA maturation factor
VQIEVSVQDLVHDNKILVQGENFVQVRSQDDAMAIGSEEWQRWFYQWIELLEPANAAGDALHPQDCYELSLRLTDDAEVQTLNRDFRHKDQPTDVLSFAALEVDCPQLPDEEPLYLGDIIISVETAARQAVIQGHSLTVELSWLAAHGLLHLLGWDHPDEDSLVEMLTQQEEMLHAIGLAVTWG